MAQFHLLALVLYGLQLVLLRHWMMAAAMLLLAGGTRFALRQMTPHGPDAPRRLLLAADGRMHIACVGGALEPVRPAGESLWLGSAVLLVLKGPARTHRVLLGRGNVDPVTLATLRRRLRGATTMPGDPAVDSQVIHRHRTSAIEHVTRGMPA